METSVYAEKSMCLDQSDSCTGSIHAPISNNASEVKQKLQDCCNGVFSEHGLEEHIETIQKSRIITSSDMLKKLKGHICSEKLDGRLCGNLLTFSEEYKGSVLFLRWSCKNNHCGLWTSSEVLTTVHNSQVFVNDLLVTSAILLSGNNYSKFLLFCKFTNLRVPDYVTFSRYQRLFCAPVIMDMWESMKSSLHAIFKDYKELILAGDGRSDSPGYSARYCVYVMMEQITNVILDLEILDKRETGGKSGNMEREGVTRILLRLKDLLDIAEITTDASTSIQKRITELKGIYLFL